MIKYTALLSPLLLSAALLLAACCSSTDASATDTLAVETSEEETSVQSSQLEQSLPDASAKRNSQAALEGADTESGSKDAFSAAANMSPSESPDITDAPTVAADASAATTYTSAAITDQTTTSAPMTDTAVPAAHALVSSLKASEGTDKLITVVGAGSYSAVVTYYRQNQDGIWEEVFSASGVLGKNGATADKREGDGKTPTGVYHFTMAFGLKEDPGSNLPYRQITDGDYWVDDSDSAYYNRLVDASTPKDWSSAEDLSKGAPYYNYALVLDYNTAQTPGMGSAIFLHCTKSSSDTGSAGCVRIPETRMKELLLEADSDTKIIIAASQDSLLAY